ncbi:MAG: hypothetical protein K9M57_09020, partial [Phycisphaerae bacterium]|nr:hypothetical protein [Phycisphaerae bacterium]
QDGTGENCWDGTQTQTQQQNQDGTGENCGDGTQTQTQQQNQDGTGENCGEGTQTQTQQQNQDGTGENCGEGTQTQTQQQNQDGTGENCGDGTGENCGDGTQTQTQQQNQDGTGENCGDGTQTQTQQQNQDGTCQSDGEEASEVALFTLDAVGSLDAIETNISIKPHLIVLNSLGQTDDIQAIVDIVLTGGYNITDFSGSFSINGTEITQATSVDYCIIDTNLFLYFPRTEIQSHPDVIALSGMEVKVDIVGSVTTETTEGQVTMYDFTGSDVVEFAQPGTKMVITKSLLAPDLADPNILIGFDTTDEGSQNLLPWSKGKGGEISNGQTFSFGYPVRLNKITMKIKPDMIDLSGKPVELWFGNAFDHVTDTHLTSVTMTPCGNLPVDLAGDQAWYITMDIDDQYLPANTDYGFMLRFQSGGSSQGNMDAFVWAMGAYAYDDGSAFTYTGNCSETLLNNELVFFLEGQEVTESPLAGDFVIDFCVNLKDFAVLAGQWLETDCGACGGVDLSGDGNVDLTDLAKFSEHWLSKL